jgi:hydrogenase nickel incorporation protein HypA/HybF
MHELSVTCSIIEVVAESAKGRKVNRVTVEVGELSGVVAESIAFWFPEVAKGTAAERANLDIHRIAGLARCEVCGAEFATPSMFSACPCGSCRFTRLRGEELNIKSIELEEAL